MNIFKNMKIGLRLGLGFGAVMLIFAAVIIITILSLKTATNSAKHVAGESLPFALLADEMAFNVVQVQQFLTDVSATHDTEVYKEAEDAAKGFMQGITKFKDMFKRKNDAKSLKEIEDLEAAFNKFYESGKYMANVYITQGIEAGNKIMEELDKTAETLSKKTAEFKRIQVDEANVNANGIVRVVYKVQIIQFVLGIVAMLLGGLIAFFITISIKRPLSQGILLAEAIAEGDLTCKIDKAVLDIGGEVGHLIRGLGKMSDSLKDSLMQIEMLAARLASVSEELSASSVQIAKGAESQTQKASQVATASTEMSATIVEIARSTSDAANAARNASKSANGGGELVRKTVDGMDSIARSVKGSAGVISGLGERSNEIGKIIKVIDDIADQTNLLALNAAIEAARAGEQGRGFAVVADEVRKLAERTTKATKEIGDMIEGIQEDTKMAVTAMETGTKEVEKGVILAKEAGEALKEIVGNVDKVTEMVQQIATASDEQSTASGQISTDIETVANVTKETATGASQIATASNELAGLASELQTMVSRFKIGEDVGSRVKGSRGLPPQALSGGQEVKRQVGAGLKALTSGGKGAVKRQQEKDAS